MWKYFDGQHAFIMKRMKDIRASSIANVQGDPIFLRPLTRRYSLFQAVYDRTMPKITKPDDLTNRLAHELRICVPVLESKQGEAIIGDGGWLSVLSSYLPSTQRPLVPTNSGR